MTVLPGARIGPYQIVGQIGSGGMGVVCRAHDSRLDVALKLLSSDRDSNHEDLLREARAIAALNHPHICTVHEVGSADGVSFIAMELIDGESLRSITRWVSTAHLPMDGSSTSSGAKTSATSG